VTAAILHLHPLAWCGLLAVLVFGGVVKGSVGIGMPLLAVPLLSQFLDLPVAMGLMTVPLLATNVGQAFEGGHTVAALYRLWPVIAAVVLGTFLGVHLLVTANRSLLYPVVGVVFVLLALTVRLAPRLKLGNGAERWAGPPVGAAAGVLGGVSGAFGPPLIVYLVGLGVSPDEFIKYMAILATSASASLMLALGGFGSLSGTDFLVSAAGLAPVWVGTRLGRWLRSRVSPARFRDLVLVVMALGGLAMLRHGLH
jgi:uncharacterized protein